MLRPHKWLKSVMLRLLRAQGRRLGHLVQLLICVLLMRRILLLRLKVREKGKEGWGGRTPFCPAMIRTEGGVTFMPQMAHPTRSPRSPNTSLREGNADQSKRPRGATAAITRGSEDGTGSGDGGRRSRRRLAAFLEGRAFAPETATDPAIVSRAAGFSTTWGGRSKQGPPSDGNGRCVLGNNSEVAFFGLGGDAIASTEPSRSMTANLVGLFENSLGLDVWTDPVASQLARPLDAILAYLPPEGARLHKESGRCFLAPGGSREALHARAGFPTSPTVDKLNGKPVATAEADTAITRARKGTATATPAQSLLRATSCSGTPSASAPLLTVTMEHGAVREAPRAVWLGRMAAVMEARGDRDEAVRLYGKAVTELTGEKEIGGMQLDGGTNSVAPSCGGTVGRGRDAKRSPRRAAGASEICSRTSGGGGSGKPRRFDDLFPYSARAHFLASMIARSYRRHFLRRGTRYIAAAFRGHLARAGDRKDRNRRVSAATFVARAWRRRMHRLGLVATRLQAVARGADGRRKARELRVVLRTAVMVQAVVRMFLAKSTAHRIRLEEASAKLLQALQRGFILRRVRATAISEIHGRMWRAASGLNRVARGFLHRRFAGMMRQVAVDREIERSEAEAGAVAGAVRTATTRAAMYLTTDAGRAELAQETRRAKAAAVRTKILMRGASPEERRRASAQDVFDSFDVDGSGTIDNTELKSLMGALGVRMTDAELRARRHLRSATGTDLQDRARRGVVRRWVTSAARDAQAKGRVRFREVRPPPLECCVCHQPFALYGDYWKHFGGGRYIGLSRRRGAERQWTRLLDERRCLEIAGVRAEAAEEARIAAKGRVGACEHAVLSTKLLAASLSGLKKDDRSSSSTSESGLSTRATQASIARLAFQAFDRDGNGALDVSDLAGLLRVVQGIPGQRLSGASDAGGASVRKNLGDAGTSADGLGIEAAMYAMDEDHSGQIDIDEFMRWFNGRVAGHGNSSHRGTGKRLFVEVLGVHDGGGGRSAGTSAHDRESDQQRPDGNAKDARSASKKATEHGGVAGGGNKEERKKGGGGKGEKQGLFGFRAWFQRAPAAAAATASTADSKKIKRKRWDEEDPEQQQQEEADSSSTTGAAVGGEGGESGAKRRRHAGDGSIAPSSPENRSITVEGQGGGRGAFFSPRRVLSGRWHSSPAICPWKKYDRTLRVVAEQRARTLLLRRARLRAQASSASYVQELARFRATRPPDFRTWSSPEFVDNHRQSVLEITMDADTAFVDALYRSLREAEDEVREGVPKPSTTSRRLPPSPLGIATAPSLAGGGSNCTTIPEAESAFADAGGNDAGGDGIGGGVGGASSKPAAALSRLRLALSLGGMTRRWLGDDPSGAVDGRDGMAATIIAKEGRSGEDFVWAVRAAESDAAAARRRTFKTSRGRAEIARTVRRERGVVVPKALEAGTRSAGVAGVLIGGDEKSEATTEAARGRQAKDELGRKGNTESLAVRMENSAGSTARTRALERNKRALVERATQLFDLFDADGSGAIDREELPPLLRQLGIWVSPDMEREVFPRLDLDCSGGVKREELATWLENEGAGFRNTPLSMLLRIGQSAQACGSFTRRLESQVRASMVARSRAAARAEAWAASRAAPTPSATAEFIEGPSTIAVTNIAPGKDDLLAEREDKAPSRNQQPIKQAHGNLGVVDAAGAAVAVPAKPVVTGGRKRGQALATRAAIRKGRIEDQEREAERELLVRAAEDEAERRVKREWRTQAGAAELRREADRMRGAGEALGLTLRAWDDLCSADTAWASRSALRRKQAEERLRHLFRLFDASCDGCIDAEELGRLLSRLNYPASEPEILGLLDKMDGDGSGDVDFSEFSDWWNVEGLRRSKRPGALILSAASALAATVAPKAAARRDAQRALISRARAKARAEVKGILLLEDNDGIKGEGVSPMSPLKAARTEASPEGRNSLSAGVIYGDTIDISSGKRGRSSGGGGLVAGSLRNRERLAAGRASKLARAEAEAYADVQATLRTSEGKRELARRTLALRHQWKEAIKAAERIACYRREKRPERATLATPPGRVSGRLNLNPEVDRKPPHQHELHDQPPVLAEFVEVPFLRLVWGVHGTATADGPAQALAGESSRVEVEPSELKYLGASLRQALPGGGGTSRPGSDRTVLWFAARPRDSRGTKRTFGVFLRASNETRARKAAENGKGKGETLSLGDIFDNDSEDQVRNLKTLTSTMLVNVTESSAAATTDVLSSSKRKKTRIKKDRTWLTDVATIAKMKKMLLTPGAFRRLATEAMLAEGRAYERHELARAIALEDGEPWRLEEAASTKREGRSARAAAPAEVDRLRATATGVAKLTRSLAQGEDLAAAECRLFLRTAAGREELRATAAAVGEKRQEQLDLSATVAAAAAAAKLVDPRRSAIPGMRTIRRLAVAVSNVAREELRRAFLLCEADGVPGEISRAEAAYVLAYAGIPQVRLGGLCRKEIDPSCTGEGVQVSIRMLTVNGRGDYYRWSEGEKAENSPTHPPKAAVVFAGPRHSGSHDLEDRGTNTDVAAQKMPGGGVRICPTVEDGGCGGGSDVRGAAVPSCAVVTPRSQERKRGNGQPKDDVRERQGDERFGGGGKESGDGSDDTSDGEFSVDMDMLDDVTSDEGFELGEMEILLAAAKTRQTLPAKALSLARLLSRRTLPASFANARDARLLLMSRARSAGRERAMHNFENLLTVDIDDGYCAAA
ncbi:unnamed protein product, partial [Scytosiphon promiscuus]